MSRLLEAIHKHRPGFVTPGQHITYADIKANLELVKDLETYLPRLGDYYTQLHPYIVQHIGVPLKKLSNAVVPFAKQEVLKSPYGADGPIDAKIKAFEADFAARFAVRYTDSSYGQMTSIVEQAEETGGNVTEAVTERAMQWQERRPSKIAINESTRFGNAIFQVIVWSYGLSTFWMTFGKSCRYCNMLRGRKVYQSVFLNGGDKLKPTKDLPTMKIYSRVAHPPLHFGCDCYLSV